MQNAEKVYLLISINFKPRGAFNLSKLCICYIIVSYACLLAVPFFGNLPADCTAVGTLYCGGVLANSLATKKRNLVMRKEIT